MSAIKEIERDLAWREAELAVLRLLLANKEITEREKLVLFRAAWALLYAHYEGFCKFALTVYYDNLRNSGVSCKHLAPRTQVFALSDRLKVMRNLSPIDLVYSIVNFQADVMEKSVSFPDVDTASNLWPQTLGELLEDADIKLGSLSAHNRALATLVSRRNKIAHGERDIIPEYDYYVGFEDAVKLVMYELALEIDQKLSI